MLTYGFFNSLNGDRVYNADQMSSMFEGLISDGIFESVGNKLQVTAGSGMNVNVDTGRAFLEDRWCRNDAIVSVAINSANVTLPRWTAVVLRKNVTNRNIVLATVDGEAAETPTKPSITRSGDVYELCLAYVYVPASATAITQENITDTRADTSVCGWVTGLIEQVDTATLFAQWEAAYQQAIADMNDFEDGLEAEMEEWQEGFQSDIEAWEASMKTAFDAWLDTLTEELNVNTYVEDYYKTASFTSGTTHTVTLDMTNYTYAAEDVITVWINGLIAIAGTDYTIDTTGAAPVLTFTQFKAASTSEPYSIVVQVIKSRIGFSS